jgi:hypothetical protein
MEDLKWKKSPELLKFVGGMNSDGLLIGLPYWGAAHVVCQKGLIFVIVGMLSCLK